MVSLPPCLTVVLVAVLIRQVVLGGRKEVRHVSYAFGHPLSEEQFGSHAQVLGVLQESETHYGSLACPQLLLEDKHI